MKTRKQKKYVIARSQTRNNYFKDLKDGEVITVTKKAEAYQFWTRQAACSMCLTLSLSGYPSDIREV